jgi:hypothetical protein
MICVFPLSLPAGKSERSVYAYGRDSNPHCHQVSEKTPAGVTRKNTLSTHRGRLDVEVEQVEYTHTWEGEGTPGSL